MEEIPKPARRWFRYSLRSIFAIMLVAAVLTAAGVKSVDSWRTHVRSEVDRLSTGYAQLQVGMGNQKVMALMRDTEPLKVDGAKIDRVLNKNQLAVTKYTLVFSPESFLDPAIYCYFDDDDQLVAKHRFD